jgi:uncharacterized protein (DUF1810 family)
MAEVPHSADDSHDLQRFLAAQAPNYHRALAEIRRGRKESHWMWYIFPQYAGLGFSPMSQEYAIKSRAEAEAYLRHPVLGARLSECMQALLDHSGKSAREIFGTPDDLKLRSCATLFAAVSPSGSAFEKVVDTYYQGRPDRQTLDLLGQSP